MSKDFFKELGKKGIPYFIGGNIIFLLICFVINRFFLFIPLNAKFLFRFLMNLAFIDGSILVIYGAINRKKRLIQGVLISFVLIILLAVVSTSKIINYEKYRGLAGEIETRQFTKEIKTVDVDKLPINNSALARNLADKKLGEIPSLGSQVTIGEFTIQNVGGELYYVAPLEHSGFFKWNRNKKGTQGYVIVSATKENEVKLVTELNGQPLNMKYLDSAYFGSYLNRYAYSKVNNHGLTDFSFELDDSGNPHWVISMYDLSIGLSGKKIVGTLIINSQTGESNSYSVEETPQWVDRIQPNIIMEENLNNWGELIHGVFNFSNRDKLMLTEGNKVLYNGEDCYYYTGITSVGADESLVGFLLTNTRSSETTMYKMSGAIETAGMKSAEGKVQQFDYEATFPILINLEEQPTYFTTLLDKKGLIKSYAFVSVSNYNIVGVGETIQQAYNSYIQGLSRDASSNLTKDNNFEEVEGTIERVGIVINNNVSYYIFTIKDTKEKFIVSTEISKEPAITTVGDTIKIKFIQSENDIITVKEFENLSIK
ncbi:MAG: cell shape-determining protein [Clostridium sp.]